MHIINLRNFQNVEQIINTLAAYFMVDQHIAFICKKGSLDIFNFIELLGVLLFFYLAL